MVIVKLINLEPSLTHLPASDQMVLDPVLADLVRLVVRARQELEHRHRRAGTRCSASGRAPIYSLAKSQRRIAPQPRGSLINIGLLGQGPDLSKYI